LLRAHYHPAERLHAPHLIDVEVVQVMRRLMLAKEITVAGADAALLDFEGLVIERHAHRLRIPAIVNSKSTRW
jgi:predicted nucleic acid-binding protein